MGAPIAELSAPGPARRGRRLLHLAAGAAVLMSGLLAHVVLEIRRTNEFGQVAGTAIGHAVEIESLVRGVLDSAGAGEQPGMPLDQRLDRLQDLAAGTAFAPAAADLEARIRAEDSAVAEAAAALASAAQQTVELRAADIQAASESVRQAAEAGLALVVAILGLGTVAGAALARQRSITGARLARAHAATAAALGQAEEADRSRAECLATISHEIRTPLNGILGYADLLLDTELDARQRSYLERVQFGGSALLAAVNDILDFEKIEAGQFRLRPRPFQLMSLVNNVTSILTDQAEQKGLRLDVEFQQDLPDTIVADEDRIRQILLNLLSNAIKFTERGNVTVLIETIDRIAGPCVRFSVRDTGIGISDDDADRLFDRYYQVGNNQGSRFGGIGLGLSISKRLAVAMGGDIGAESVPGIGSNFWFTVPRVLPPHRDPDEIAGSPLAATRRESARLLLVEDLACNRELGAAMLNSMGYEVDFAGNGAEAIEKVKAGTYDLILMDIQMPGMDGITATRHIRSLNHPTAAVPVIATTANFLPHQVKMFGEAGMSGHIPKPLKRDELEEKLARYLRRAGHGSVQSIPGGSCNREGESMEPHECDKNMRVAKELRRRIDALLVDRLRGDSDRLSLARRAHDLISLAAILGFEDLAEACAALEEICRKDETINPDLSGVKTAADAAKLRLERLFVERAAG